MIKINYPLEASRLKDFNSAYCKKISESIGDHTSIDMALAKVKMSSGTPLSLDKLLSAPFDQLLYLNDKIKALGFDDQIAIEKLQNYTFLQPTIASFFMGQDELKLSSCHYCNIDYIYTFSELGDYLTPLDFIRRATPDQFELIRSIGRETSKRILAKRTLKQFESLDDCPVSPTIREKIKSYDYQANNQPTHNHFTLDHFFHQADYQYIKLCLYNLVPCCYACNSKFKNAKKLYNKKALLSSPTSATFSFHEDVSFKIYFAVAEPNVNNLNDFSVDLVADNNPDAHGEFIKVLKLRGRYTHHKREALRLLKLKIEYPDTVLQSLADTLGKSKDELKRQLFGVELYDDNYVESSLVKFKRDIARDIKLL